jgi:chorismate-pyruvate lyase
MHEKIADPLDAHRARPKPAYLMPPEIEAWVTLPGSMTRTVTRLCGRPPEVRPLYEGPGDAAPWERRILRIHMHRVYLRKIALVVDGTEVIRARTVARLDDPALDMLRRLGRAPLAEVLFSDERWQRPGPPVPLQVKRTGPEAPTWGRGCLWQRTGSPGGQVLVEEYFHPALLRHGDPLPRTKEES